MQTIMLHPPVTERDIMALTAGLGTFQIMAWHDILQRLQAPEQKAVIPYAYLMNDIRHPIGIVALCCFVLMMLHALVGIILRSYQSPILLSLNTPFFYLNTVSGFVSFFALSMLYGYIMRYVVIDGNTKLFWQSVEWTFLDTIGMIFTGFMWLLQGLFVVASIMSFVRSFGK